MMRRADDVDPDVKESSFPPVPEDAVPEPAPEPEDGAGEPAARGPAAGEPATEPGAEVDPDADRDADTDDRAGTVVGEDGLPMTRAERRRAREEAEARGEESAR